MTFCSESLLRQRGRLAGQPRRKEWGAESNQAFGFAFGLASRSSRSALRRLRFSRNSGVAWLSAMVCLAPVGLRLRRSTSSAICCSADRVGLIICFLPSDRYPPTNVASISSFRFGRARRPAPPARRQANRSLPWSSVRAARRERARPALSPTRTASPPRIPARCRSSEAEAIRPTRCEDRTERRFASGR